MFDGTTRREALEKVGASALAVVTISIAGAAGIHGYATGRHLIMSTIGLLFAAGMTGLLIFVLYRWAFPTRRR